MKNYIFLPQEILSLTAGKMAIYHYSKGVSIEFIKKFITNLNVHFTLQEIAESIEFSAYIPFENDLVMFNSKWNVWNLTYKYDEKTKLFYTKKEFLYKVLLHLDIVEKQIFNLCVSKKDQRKMEMFKKSCMKKDISDALTLSFNVTKKCEFEQNIV